MKKSDLQIRLLGPLEIRRGEKLLQLPSSKKARALLAYLIANNRKHRRDRLTELLWDVADDPKSGLRWCLTRIRPLVDDRAAPRILADRETVEFVAGNATVDLFLLREKSAMSGSLALKDLKNLAALFRGSFIEGLDLPDYDRFQAWLVAAREDVLQQHVSILRAITKELSDNPSAAVPYARLLLDLDPLNEQARALLCTFLLKLGRPSEAKQLLEAGKRLARELGASGSGELTAAERELSRANALPRGEPDSRVPDSPEHHEQPNWASLATLVGRSQESARLRSTLENSMNRRQGSVTIITGEPGVGKTRLLAELSSHVSSVRGTVLPGRSHEAEARRPYGPWIDAMQWLHPAAMGEVLRGKLAPLLTGVRDDRPNEDQGWRKGKDQLFASVIELLGARAHSAPPVLLQFDDVHWCDEASAELLHYVVRMTRHRPVSVVLTARSGELPDNEAVMRMLRGFRREGWLDEMELLPLSREDTAQLARSVAPTANPKSVFDESAGNPLYAIELARAADNPEKSGTSTLTGLIRDRIDRLPAVASDVLKWAAVLGARFSLNRLAALVTLDGDGLMKALEVLDRHGLLKDSSPSAGPVQYGFTHHIVCRSVYDDISEPRRRLMHSRIAQMLEKEANSPTTAAEVVHHATLARETAIAAKASVAAGRYCLRVYANREALAFARSGLRYAEGLNEPERTSLQIELLELSLSAERPKDTREVAQRLEELAEQALALGRVEHARLGFHLLSYLHWEGGEWSDARRQTLRAESVARAADPKEHVVAMAEAARCLALLERDLGKAEALVLEARARATNVGVETAAIPDALGMLRFHQGELEHAASLFQAARSLSQRQGDRAGEFRALEHLVVLELERKRPQAARELCRELAALAGKLREGSEVPFARCLEVLVEDAFRKESTQEIDAALESLRMADAKHRLAYALLTAADRDLEQGQPQKARTRGEEALRLAELLERPTETALAHVVLLRCALSKGAAREAERHAQVLRNTNLTAVAAHVRSAAEGLLSGKIRRTP